MPCISVLEELKKAARSSFLIQKRILKYFGHSERKDDSSIEKLRVEGLDGILEQDGIHWNDCKPNYGTSWKYFSACPKKN